MAFLFFSGGVLADESWTLSREENGIQVFSRPIPGSGAREFKGVRILPAEAPEVLAVFRDIPAATKWFASCIEARKISGDETKLRVYYRFHIPWPFWNRDAVYDVAARMDGKRAVIEAAAVSAPEIPSPSRHVRILDSRQLWIIEQVGPGRTRVTYTSRILPEGSIPDYLANSAVEGFVYYTLEGLGEVLKDAGKTPAGQGRAKP